MEHSRRDNAVIASYVSPHAFAPRVRAALSGLGYRVVAATTRGRFSDDRWKPDLRIIDDRHFDRLPPENSPPRIPVIMLGGVRPRGWHDPRIVGEIARPASLQEIYPLIQRALEANPRHAARAPTQLPARCTRADQRWMGDVVSLSTRGCLFRGAAELDPDHEFNLFFPLPRGRMVHTRARTRHQAGDQVGMEFCNPPEGSLRAIEEYVSERLATARV